jgi:hypothetical protein
MVIKYFKKLYKKYKTKQMVKKKIKELRKRDPFIYK